MASSSAEVNAHIFGIDISTGAYEDDVSILESDGIRHTPRYVTTSNEYPRMKCIMGRKFSDWELQSELSSFPFQVTEGPDGFPVVKYEEESISPTKLITEWLAEYRDGFLGHLNLKNENVSNCCIAVPVHFTYQQRRELLHAATVARWRPCRLLHDTTASVLTYRFCHISSSDLLEDGKKLNMAFIDIGYSSMQVSIVELQKNQLRVLSHSHDKSLGGRAFDDVLFKHFSTVLEVNTSDLESSIEFLNSCEKLKIELSWNLEAEFSGAGKRVVMKRVEFENVSSRQLERVKVVLQKAMSATGLNVKDVHSVELVGSASYMPAIMNIIKDIFKKDPRQTMPLDRLPIARGCSIDCAMLCGASKLPKFQIMDILPYSIEVDDMTEKQVVFLKGSPMPNTKNVIFLRSNTFFLDLLYINLDDTKDSSEMISYMIGPFPSREGQMEVNVTIQLDLHGMAYIESAKMGSTIIPVVEYSNGRFHAHYLQHFTQSEHETIVKDAQKVENELIGISMQLKSSLNMETKRRIEVEKILEKVEIEVGQSSAHHKTTKELEEKLQIEREKAKALEMQLQIERKKASALKEVEKLRQTIERGYFSGDVNFTNFSIAELTKATANFDNSLMIGQGGFGDVYKGFLQHRTVAIKKLNEKSLQGEREFNQEVNMLSELRHRHLVKLIGANLEARALVYEFLPNGSLDTFLNKSPPLSWETRIRFASEICSVLIYLHSRNIAHGDIKPSNILLDADFVCKLSDFGISRQLIRSKNTETETPSHTTNVPKFTPIYVDPDFLSTRKLTHHSDTFSFGIMLLQFITGINLDKPEKSQDLRYNVEVALEKNMFDMIIDFSAGEWPFEKTKGLASLGLKCSEQSRKRRPDLANIVLPFIESMKPVTEMK